MDRSVKINLAGSLFQLDQDAYYELKAYLTALEANLKNTHGDIESLDDIEARIAEIFASYKGSAGTINLQNVKDMEQVIGKPEDFESPASQPASQPSYQTPPQYNSYDNGRGVVNSIFSAIGRFFYIIFRVFAIAFGVFFVVTGFCLLIVLFFTLFVKNQQILPSHLHVNFFYLPDFLDFVIQPSLTPWVCVLGSIVVVLPLLALIYWGTKLIFWFRSRDGVVSLVAFVLWAISLTALLVMLAGQGLNFSETGRVSSTIVIENPPDTIWVVTGRKVSSLKYDRDITFPDNSYSVYANTDSLQISIGAKLDAEPSESETGRIEVIRRSASSTRHEAGIRAESIPYNYSFSHDTLKIDEYFTLPAKMKWSGDEVRTRLLVPTGTVLSFTGESENLLGWRGDYYDDAEYNGNSKFWVMTQNGLRATGTK